MNCPNCGAIDSLAPIKTQDGDEFILVSKPSNGNFVLPPNGISVKALGCTNCGTITLGTPELVGMPLTKN